MKFRDGDWLMRDGVRAFHPAVAHRVVATNDRLTVLAPTVAPRDRSEMHDLVALTVELSSPTVDVIRVRVTHHAGARRTGPYFPVFEGVAPGISVVANDSVASLQSGRLTARLNRSGPWRLDFVAEGRILTSSDAEGMAAIEWPGHGERSLDASRVGRFMAEALSLGVGEHVYGLGERFGPFVKNGQSIDIWNRDGGTGSEQAYKNVPFYLTDAGYGVFVNEPGRVDFEIATERVERVGFSVEGQSLEYLVIYGPSPKEILERFTGLVGRPALPPAWSFGLWLSTSFTTNYDEATVSSFVDGMAEREIPLSVLHFDSFWMREFQWVDFTWDERVFPDPVGMLARLHERGLRVCVWINPYIAQASPLFEEAAAAGFLLKRQNGDPWQGDQWQPGMGIVDFTNPGARTWYRSKLAALLDQGVDSFKTDFGERIPTDVVWHDGSDPQRMHNFYTYIYNETVFDLLREQRGSGEAVVFARSATACSWLFPVHWGGDCESTFPSMADTLRGGLSLGLSGFGFWSHDIGGFEGTPPPQVYQRWAQFGLLSSHSRLHGSNSYRVPWLVQDESVEVVREFARLKCRLMPYLYRAAVEVSQSGVPMMRAMLLEFPDDPTAAFLDRQYMLGASLLVAPIFSDDGSVKYYVPAGRWTHLTTGAMVVGPAWISERHGASTLPLLVRPGSVIAMGARGDRADYDFAEDVTLRAFELEEGVTVDVRVPDIRGASDSAFQVTSAGGVVVAQQVQGIRPWRLMIVNLNQESEVTGGRAESTPEGLLVVPSPGSKRVEVALRAR